MKMNQNVWVLIEPKVGFAKPISISSYSNSITTQSDCNSIQFISLWMVDFEQKFIDSHSFTETGRKMKVWKR